MGTTVRLTKAQRSGLALLAHPGAEARTARGIRWAVMVHGEQIGSIHSQSLLALRVARLVIWERGDTPLDYRQRITEAGRMYVQAHAGQEAPGDDSEARGAGGGANGR